MNKQEKIRKYFDMVIRPGMVLMSGDRQDIGVLIQSKITEEASLESMELYSEEEIDQLLALYEGPFGEKMLEVTKAFGQMMVDKMSDRDRILKMAEELMQEPANEPYPEEEEDE